MNPSPRWPCAAVVLVEVLIHCECPDTKTVLSKDTWSNVLGTVGSVIPVAPAGTGICDYDSLDDMRYAVSRHPLPNSASCCSLPSPGWRPASQGCS